MSEKSIKSDLTKLDRIKDADIDYSDIPSLGNEFFTKAMESGPPRLSRSLPPPKKNVRPRG